jgi:hypothetical protein
LNVLGKKHGLENPKGAHDGDLRCRGDPSGHAEYVEDTDPCLTLGPKSALDADGSATDDHTALPARLGFAMGMLPPGSSEGLVP